MGKTVRKKRDASGPFKGSYQRKKYGIGRRKEAGIPCPKSSKKKKSLFI